MPVKPMSGESSENGSTKEDGPGGNPAKTETAILSKLLFDEEEFLGRLEATTERAMKFLRIEPRTGRVVLQEEAKRLKVRDQIRLLLAGRYFAMKLSLVPNEKMHYREIAVELNRPPNGISPELTDLVRDNDLARDDEGLVSMPFHRIDGTLRELEVAQPSEGDSPIKEHVRHNGTRRASRQRADPVVQAMLEKPMDLSEFSWIPRLRKAMDKGLAALLVAKEKYDVNEMTCAQMATFLTRTFPIDVTRAAINMAFLEIKSQYVAPSARGKEIMYSLLPLGRQYVLKVAQEVRASLEQGQKESETDNLSAPRSNEE